MIRAALAVLLLVIASIGAYAQFNGCPPGFCNTAASGGGGGPPANALLSQAGVCILAQTGSCLMVQ